VNRKESTSAARREKAVELSTGITREGEKRAHHFTRLAQKKRAAESHRRGEKKGKG